MSYKTFDEDTCWLTLLSRCTASVVTVLDRTELPHCSSPAPDKVIHLKTRRYSWAILSFRMFAEKSVGLPFWIRLNGMFNLYAHSNSCVWRTVWQRDSQNYLSQHRLLYSLHLGAAYRDKNTKESKKNCPWGTQTAWCRQYSLWSRSLRASSIDPTRPVTPSLAAFAARRVNIT